MPTQSQPVDEDHDAAVHAFLIQSHRVATEAQFIVDSLPNADPASVRRAVTQLDSIKTVLLNLHDEATTQEELAELVFYTARLMEPLQCFLDSDVPAANSSVPRTYSGDQGRPMYSLDLRRAQALHDLGNTWKDISKAMGVARSTLYNHMHDQGICWYLL